MQDAHDSNREPDLRGAEEAGALLRPLDENLAAELIDAEHGRRLPVEVRALGRRGARIHLREPLLGPALPRRTLLEFRAGPRGPLLLLPCRTDELASAGNGPIELAFVLDGSAPLRFTLEALDAFLAAPARRLRRAG